MSTKEHELNENMQTAVQKEQASPVEAPAGSLVSEAETPAPEVQKSASKTLAADQPTANVAAEVEQGQTARPRLTPEENKQLRSGARFFSKAMESMSAAQGESYRPYRIPPEMRAALSRLDEEAVKEKRQELIAQAEKEGRSLSEEELQEATRTLTRMHAVDEEELNELEAKRKEQARIDAGGARFFSKYQELVSGQASARESVKTKMKRNLKIFGIVMIGLAGYMFYNEYIFDRQAQTLSELKAMVPMTIDSFTTLVRIDDRNDDFKLYFERDPAAYAEVDEHQKNALLDNMANSAPALCKNQLLYGIIASGKKVTVLLDAEDKSFHREFTVEKCPAKSTPE